VLVYFYPVTQVRRENYYDILQLKKGAKLSAIEKQYSNLVQTWESVGGNIAYEKILELTRAYRTLSSPYARRDYDASLDFDFVMLDGKISDPDMEEAYETYLQTRKKNYKKIISEFNQFKSDLGDTLYILKTSSIYFLISLFAYSVFYVILSHMLTFMPDQYKELFGNLSVPFFFLLAILGYLAFRKFYQIPGLKELHRKRNSRK